LRHRTKERRDKYEKVAGDFKQAHVLNGYHHFRRLELTLSFLSRLGKNLLILDAGCGDGLQIEHYSQSGRAYGMDISWTRLKRAQERLNGCPLFLADLFDIPVKANRFDVVILGEVIEHMEEPHSVLAEIHRVLKPSGHLILDTPSKSNIADIILRMWGVQPTWGYEVDKTHLWFFSMRRVVELLENAGYRLIRIRGGPFIRYTLPIINHCTWVKNRWWAYRLFDLTFEKLPVLNRLGAIQIFLAQKVQPAPSHSR
jgi:ubiquinone/menaquinone biosynthesis C-methylase UbiE